MTQEEFAVDYPPGPGDEIVPCHCGSFECPGWKLWNRERAIAEMEAMERLPGILIEAVGRLGERIAVQREEAYLDTFLKGG